MNRTKYEIIFNYGRNFERHFFEKEDFIAETSKLIKKPKKIFLGMGNFLELGDYNNLLDSILFDETKIKLEKLLDQSNRMLSEWGTIPFSFFKLAVYFPDYLLKDVPIYCVSTIGKKSRLAPGAETFIQYIKDYDPLIMSAMPYEIAIEFVKRLNLDHENLISTQYKTALNKNNKMVYAGGINKFVSGEIKNIEIEKRLIGSQLTDDDVLYIGSGEAGLKTFSWVKNSIAFNPPKQIMSESHVNIYGSSLESLIVLFNENQIHNSFLMSRTMDDLLPSLIVYSDTKEKSESLLEIELEHRQFQRNILSQRVIYSSDSYDSVINEINIDLKGSPIGIDNVKELITKRILKYTENPRDIILEIYNIAVERYEKVGEA